jgi:hypothetical protein
MALKRRRNGNSGSIDSARTSSYSAVRGIRRIDSPTDKSGVFTVKNFDVDDDRSLILRDPILLYKNKPAGVTGTFYKVVYSFDGNRLNDLYITSNGIYNSTGTLVPIKYKDVYGKENILVYNANLSSAYNYKINDTVTYSNFSTSTIINNIEVKLPDGYIGSRFVKHTIVDNQHVLEALIPTEINLNKTSEGEGIIFNPNFYNDVFQDVRDNYSSQTFDVLGILQYVLYDHVTKKVIATQLNNLNIETLLRSKANPRYTIAASVPEGTGIYLKAFVNIKKYPKTKIYCSWEETIDGVNYNTCPEFKTKFANYLINLKVRKDEVDVTSELKSINVTPFELFSDADNVLNRPDVLFVKSDNKTRRFVVYALPSYEIIEGKENKTYIQDLKTTPSTATNRSSDLGINTNDLRPYSFSSYNPISNSDLEERFKVFLDTGLTTLPLLSVAQNEAIRKTKNNLQEISVLQEDKTTQYTLEGNNWFIRAEIEYQAGYPGAPSPNIRFEYLRKSGTSTTLLDSSIETVTVEFPNIPHKIKNLYVTNWKKLPWAVFPWNIKTKTSGSEITNEPSKLNTGINGNSTLYGDFTEINPTLDVIKEDQYKIYGLSSKSIKKQDYINSSLSGFTLSNINEIDHNAFNANLEVDGFNISFNNSIYQSYEIVSSPVIATKIADTISGQYVSSLHTLSTIDNIFSNLAVFTKPNYALLNKNNLNVISVPKQEVNISKVYNTDVYNNVMQNSGLTLKSITTMIEQPYVTWLNLLSVSTDIESRNSRITDVNYGHYYSLLGREGSTSLTDEFITVDTVLKVKEVGNFAVSTQLTVERPNVKSFYDSCYTVKNKSEFVYEDAKKVFYFTSYPASSVNYHRSGNEYEYVVGTSVHSLLFKGSHIAYINRNQINNIKTVSFLETASLLSNEVVVDNVVIEKPSKALGLLNYKKALYAFGNSGFKNNILVSKTDSFEFPLTNVLDLDASQDNKVNSLVPWRDYLIAATNNAIYLITKINNGFTNKAVNTFTGVSEVDRNTLMPILNGLLFKNGSKIFSLSPNPNSSVDSILSISELSKPVGELLNLEPLDTIGFTTETYYGIFLTLSDKTLLIKYDYGTRVFTLMEYTIRVKQVFIDNIQNIIITDINGKQYYFNKKFPDAFVDIIGYGDVLNVEYPLIGELTAVTPISFEIDSGEKSDDMGYEKNFVETRITFGLKSSKEVIPVTLDVYTDGHKQIAHKAVETDSPFWNDSLDDLAVLNTGFDTNNSQIINTLKELRIRHHGFGKTLRHVITGNSVTKFKIYVVYYKYRTLPGEE